MAGAVRRHGLANLLQIARPQPQSGSRSPIARFLARAESLWSITEWVEHCFPCDRPDELHDRRQSGQDGRAPAEEEEWNHRSP
jgi:hypothetical protein